MGWLLTERNYSGMRTWGLLSRWVWNLFIISAGKYRPLAVVFDVLLCGDLSMPWQLLYTFGIIRCNVCISSLYTICIEKQIVLLQCIEHVQFQAKQITLNILTSLCNLILQLPLGTYWKVPLKEKGRRCSVLTKFSHFNSLFQGQKRGLWYVAELKKKKPHLAKIA